MPEDKIRDLARIFATIVKEHGVANALAALPEETYFQLYLHFMGVQKDNSQQSQK